MLPELMIQRLKEKKLPKIYPTKTLVERGFHRILTAKRRANDLRNAMVKSAKLLSPLAVRKAISIKDTSFSGYRTKMRNAYIGKYGDELHYKVDYTSNLVRPTIAKITQSIGDVKTIKTVLFKHRGETYSITVDKKLEKPESLRCSASVTSELGLFKYDSISETYDVGLFDDRYKPVSEYPISNADNVVLDVAYDWKIGVSVYPPELPSGLIIDKISVSFLSGFIDYERKKYKDPSVNNTIRLRARIVNKTGDILKFEHWGTPLSVLYEDNKHVSQINVDVGIPTRTLYGYGEYYEYYLDINLPTWCYGKIAVCHAMNFYKGGKLYIYGGGPFICLESFRLRLP